VSPPRLLRLVWVLVLWAAAPPAAWGGPAAKVFPLASKKLPAGLEAVPDRLTDTIAKLIGAKIAEGTINSAALASGCSLDDSTCLDQIARVHRVKEIVFGTVRVADDQRIFVKLTRYIAGTERREKTFVLTSESPRALSRQLARSARDMFDLPPPGGEPGEPDDAPPDGEPEEPARPRRKPPKETPSEEPEEPTARPGKKISILDEGPAPGEPGAARRGRVTAGTYLLLSGGVMAMATGTGFAIAGAALRGDAANARKTTPDDTKRISAIDRAARIRTTTGTVLLVSGGLAVAGGVVRAILQRRPSDSDRAVSIVPVDGGAAVVFSGRLP
jgi:hypothetical protein